MPKVRLGVALLVPSPLLHEIDGLRRALGDGGLGRIPAHLTLVPPVNVNLERLPEALAVVRAAAEATRPFAITTGAPATFFPDNPVLYLPVVEGAPEITALRDRVFRAPLARSLTWPFVPHITIADEAAPERIAAAQTALADFRLEAEFDRVHLLQQGDGRVWRPIADAAFETPTVLGRGGLPLELTVTTILDPEAADVARITVPAEVGQLAITARRDGRVIGVLVGSTRGAIAEVHGVAVIPEVRDEGVDDHLRAAFYSYSSTAE
ncbi:MAG TPA: 2'-5' RNA ligase family protein [Acidimicrobiales bacterium]|nr:2'-5' RNA ligase family protein [Acidimicrobiales bacterium]